MRAATASELADYLERHVLVNGPQSRSQSERILWRHFGYLSREQMAQAIIVADCRKQIVRENGGETLRRAGR